MAQRQLVRVRQKPRYLEVRNWERFQHYRDRKPIWIKFYVETLDDTELRRLPYATRLLWDQILLLAARFDNRIPNDPEEISYLTRIDLVSVQEGIAALLQGAWIRETRASKPASKPLAETEQDASPRARPRARGEAEAEAEKEKGRAVRSETTTRANGATNGQPVKQDREDQNRLATELLSLVDRDADERTPTQIRAFTTRLPASAFAKVIESVRTQNPRNRAAYAVGALQSEFAELAGRRGAA
jgi:hypothetical protein